MKDYGHEFADIFYYTPNEFEKLGGLWPLRTGHNIAKANYSVGLSAPIMGCRLPITTAHLTKC